MSLTENRGFLSPGGTAAITDTTYDGEGKRGRWCSPRRTGADTAR